MEEDLQRRNIYDDLNELLDDVDDDLGKANSSSPKKSVTFKNKDKAKKDQQNLLNIDMNKVKEQQN